MRKDPDSGSESDALQAYLRAISRIPRLAPEAEREPGWGLGLGLGLGLSGRSSSSTSGRIVSPSVITEALATTPNIFLYDDKRGEGCAMPVTPASAKLFLRKLTGKRFAISSAVVTDLLGVLRAAFWTWVGQMNPRVRTSFP